MAKLGTERRPVIVRVQTQERAAEVAAICNERGWRFMAGIEPDKPEDVTDLERLLNPAESVRVEKQPGRNAPCPCGSGKKYKKCSCQFLLGALCHPAAADARAVRADTCVGASCLRRAGYAARYAQGST